jgi:hypothetical protein
MESLHSDEDESVGFVAVDGIPMNASAQGAVQETLHAGRLFPATAPAIYTRVHDGGAPCSRG